MTAAWPLPPAARRAAQAALFHSIKPLFANKPVLIVANKTDVVKMEELEPEVGGRAGGRAGGPVGRALLRCAFLPCWPFLPCFPAASGRPSSGSRASLLGWKDHL